MNKRSTSSGFVLLLAYPTDWMDRYGGRPRTTAPLRLERREDGQVRLLDIMEGIGPDWCPPERLTGSAETIEISTADWDTARALAQTHGASTAMIALAEAMAAFSDDWETFHERLTDDRFEASAWFERDRKNLVLTDQLAGEDLVSLWDEEVTVAIEDGHLIPPRGPRPHDHDWTLPLVDYARAMGLLKTAQMHLTDASLTPKSRRPAGTPTVSISGA